jgi:SAM-dependent methyltransferase
MQYGIRKSGSITAMHDYFTNRDAAIAKYKFLELRERYGIKFDYKYEVSDAALKYYYVLSHVEAFVKNKKEIKLLEVGCGSGHLIKIISNIFNIQSEGFDPILKNSKVRIRESIKLRKPKNCKLWRLNNLDFEARNENNFDLIIDLCAVTHFNVVSQSPYRFDSGWDWLIKFSKGYLKSGGIIISATDTVINPHLDKEFLKPVEIFTNFEESGLKISNVNVFPEIANLQSSFSEEIFLRYGRPFQSKKPIELAVLGFTAGF